MMKACFYRGDNKCLLTLTLIVFNDKHHMAHIASKFVGMKNIDLEELISTSHFSQPVNDMTSNCMSIYKCMSLLYEVRKV